MPGPFDSSWKSRAPIVGPPARKGNHDFIAGSELITLKQSFSAPLLERGNLSGRDRVKAPESPSRVHPTLVGGIVLVSCGHL
jgi:hypothetical protein